MEIDLFARPVPASPCPWAVLKGGPRPGGWGGDYLFCPELVPFTDGTCHYNGEVLESSIPPC